MLSKSTIKEIRSLRQKKYRQKYHKIIVEGTRSVVDILHDHQAAVLAIYASEDWLVSHQDILKPPVEIEAIDPHVLASLSTLTSPQDVIAICRMPEQVADPAVVLSSLCLYLDGIRDPGNAGTIFRIADWFGIRTVFLSEDTVDPFNPKVIQASMGSIFRIDCPTISLEAFRGLSSLQAWVTTMEGEDVFTAELSDSGLIILGNESVGVREGHGLPSREIAIPRKHSSGAESLNVAVAAGIICAEFARRMS